MKRKRGRKDIRKSGRKKKSERGRVREWKEEREVGRKGGRM